MTRFVASVGALLLFAGCGDDGGSPDSSSACATDAECDDGLFCNGAESCAPGTAADARGCVPGADPCPLSCDEANDQCLDSCPDGDGDGFASIDCGGDDCDDTDDERYPGNIEICDAEGRDEDCDPTTYGPDDDRDGFVALECCNEQRDGSLRCGRDCNDGSRAIAPGAVDPCGNGDEDCDGDVDEDPGRVLFRDLDGDGQGTRDDTILGCEAGSGYVLLGDDCDDADDRRSPDFEEVCDMADRDENCDGIVNPGCPCSPGDMRVCGASDVGECALGVQSCLVVTGDEENARWADECLNERVARDELCNGLDDDCDGSADESFECASGTVAMGTNACGRDGTRVCNDASCTWQTLDFARTESVATCDYCDDTGVGVAEPLATRMEVIPLSEAHLAVDFLGDAKRAVGPLGIPAGEWCFRAAEGEPNRICLSDPSHYGAVSVGPFSLGYAGLSIDAPVRQGGSGAGFAVSLIEPGAGDLLGPGGAALGVPLGREGISVEWRGYDPANVSNPRPTLTVRRLESPSDRILATVPDPESLPASDSQLRVLLEPDVPLSAENETRLEVATRTSSGWNVVYECGPAVTVCSFAIDAGTPMEVLLSSSVTPGGSGGAGFVNQRTEYQERDFVDAAGLCPE